MVAERTKKMPKGVGKRIVESLKSKEKELEADEDLESEVNEVDEDIQAEEEPEKKPVRGKKAQKEEEEQEEEEENLLEDDEEEEQESPLSDINDQANTPSSDIDTLLHLISKLPSGVTKQTGALIIRQTMEAMGISMNNVLSNAQSAQEELENNIKNNVNVIEEYRNNIKILEQEIQKYRKKAHELEDIISLFILSEDKK